MKVHFSLPLTLLIVLFATVAAFAQPTTPSPRIAAANELLKEKKLDEAARAFGEIARDEPQNGRAWFGLGMSLHLAGKYAEAVEAFKKNVAISQNPTAMYNVASGLARLNRKDEAFEWLEKAIVAGFAQFADLDADADLENLRGDPRYKKMQDLIERQIAPCRFMPEAKQFDFWIGDWDVFNVQGQKVGVNSIQSIADGCGLLENWTSTLKNNGKSINYFDPSTGKWYQFWIGSGGGALRFEGAFKDGAMRFEGVTTANGKSILNRLTFSKIDDKTVRQFAEISSDDGKTWSVSYDFKYVRAIRSQPNPVK
jgi:tetratricopeptide (TPR) repeat protein